MKPEPAEAASQRMVSEKVEIMAELMEAEN
jgi:hypothetical protein